MPGTNSPHKIDKGQVEDILFSDIGSKPTTVSGYGITDAYTKTESDNRFVRFDSAQALNPTQQQQARDNIGVGAGSGTVTSVGLSAPSIFGVSGSPVTESGTLSISLSSQSEYTVFARGSGSGEPSFLSLSESHIPSLSISKVSGLQTALDDINNNHYVHPTQSVIDTGVMSGATVLSRINVNTLGHVQSVSTRSLTPANIGAENALTFSNGVTRVTNDIQLDSTVVRTTGDQVVQGLKKFRAGVAGGATTPVGRWEYPDNSGDTYNLILYNDSDSNNVRWFFHQKNTVGTNDVDLDLPVLGFQNGVTIIGADNYENTEVSTYYEGQTNPATRYKQSLYVKGDSVLNGNMIVGQANYTNTSFLESAGDDFIFSNGVIFAREGLRTVNPDNSSNFDHTSWKLGEASINVQADSTHTIRISVDGVLYDLMAIAV